MKVIPEEATRLAALKRGEVDIAYSIRGELAEELQKTPGLTLKPVVIQGTFWLYFPDQWDAQVAVARPARARGGAAGDRLQVHQRGADARLFAGHRQHHLPTASTSTGRRRRPVTIPQGQEAAGRGGPSQWLRCRRLLLRLLLRQSRRGGDQQPAGGRHPRAAAAAGARRLLQAATPTRSSRTSSRPSRRVRQRRDPAETFAVKGGAYAYGNYPEIDALFAEQAVELDQDKRTAMLHKMQQIVHERTMLRADLAARLPQWRGPASRRIGLRPDRGLPYTAPYEDITLKNS